MQIMIFMTIFDVIGLAAYAFTTLPTTICMDHMAMTPLVLLTQGFFIQVGTVAVYMDISLPFYYYLAITRGVNIFSHIVRTYFNVFRLWYISSKDKQLSSNFILSSVV